MGALGQLSPEFSSALSMGGAWEALVAEENPTAFKNAITHLEKTIRGALQSRERMKKVRADGLLALANKSPSELDKFIDDTLSAEQEMSVLLPKVRQISQQMVERSATLGSTSAQRAIRLKNEGDTFFINSLNDWREARWAAIALRAQNSSEQPEFVVDSDEALDGAMASILQREV